MLMLVPRKVRRLQAVHNRREVADVHPRSTKYFLQNVYEDRVLTLNTHNKLYK